MSLFRTKPIDTDLSRDTGLRRSLGAFDLTLLGIGTVIGAGIFVLTGITAATQAGPAVVLSFVIAAFACGCAALAYAELASAIGSCGSAYGYASLGELASLDHRLDAPLRILGGNSGGLDRMVRLPALSMLSCGYLTLQLGRHTWFAFAAWMAIGLAIFFLYSRRSSRLAVAAPAVFS